MTEFDWLPAGARRDTQTVRNDWTHLPETMIEGVRVVDIRPVLTSYGRLVEVVRRDWFTDGDQDIDQVFASILSAGAISAWHAHARTLDRISVISGRVLLVLHDSRPRSASFGMTNQFHLGEHRPALVCIPPQVWHGLHNVGDQTATVLNAVDHAYAYAAPDHFRLPADCPAIPFRFPSARNS